MNISALLAAEAQPQSFHSFCFFMNVCCYQSHRPERFLQAFVHNHTNLRTNPPPSLPPSFPLTLPSPSSVLWQCQVSRSARSSLRPTQITFQSPQGSSCRTRFVPLLVIEWHFTSNPHMVGLWPRCLLFFHALNLTGRLSQSDIACSAPSKEKLWVKAFCFSLILSISEPTVQICWHLTTKSYLMHDNEAVDSLLFTFILYLSRKLIFLNFLPNL